MSALASAPNTRATETETSCGLDGEAEPATQEAPSPGSGDPPSLKECNTGEASASPEGGAQEHVPDQPQDPTKSALPLTAVLVRAGLIPENATSEDLEGLAHHLFKVYLANGSVSYLQMSTQLLQDQLDAVPFEHPRYPWLAKSLGGTLFARYQRTDDAGDLDRAIGMYQAALASLGIDPEQGVFEDLLARMLLVRYERLGRTEDLEELLLLRRQALAQCGQNDLARPILLDSLASVLCIGFKRCSRLEYLQEAVRLLEEALQCAPTDRPDKYQYLTNLGNALSSRFEVLGDFDDMQQAIRLYRCAAAQLSSSSPAPSTCATVLCNFACALCTRFVHLGANEDLEEAICLLRRALDTCPNERSVRTRALNNLASSLCLRFERLGNMADIEEAISLHREVLELLPAGDEARPGALNNLAGDLITFHKMNGNTPALDEAIALLRGAMSTCDPAHHAYGTILNGLASALSLRFELLGDMENLEDATKLHRQVLEDRPLNHPERAQSLNNLANVLSVRFEQLGKEGDLVEATQLRREVLESRPQGHTHRAMAMHNLAVDLIALFHLSGDVEKLEEAVRSEREVLDLCPPGHPGRAGAQESLANALDIRFAQRRVDADLDMAIQLHREALSLRPASHPERYKSLMNLAIAYRSRFASVSDSQPLADARELMLEALEYLNPGHAERSWCLCAIARLHVQEGAPFFSLASALEYLAKGVLDPHRNAQLRLSDALQTLDDFPDVGRIPDESVSALLEVYGHIIRLLPRVAYFGLGLSSRLQVLKKAESVSLEAASLALRLGQPSTALEMLEEGRATFWAQALRLRTPLDRVPEELRNELRELAQQLEKSSFDPGEEALSRAATEEVAATRRRQSQRFEALVREVRKNRDMGLEHFMLPVGASTLVKVAEKGPLVVLLASKISCDAIIVKPSGDVSHVFLLDVDVRLLRSWGETVRDSVGSRLELVKQKLSSSIDATPKEDDMVSVLEEMWDKVVSQILSGLGLQPKVAGERPRLWWCPTGPFSFLPIHAAGYHSGQGACCMDYVVSSYTPTIGALQTARLAMRKIPRSHIHTLLAAVPYPFRGTPLPFTVHEICDVKKVIPSDALLLLSPEDDVSLGPPNAGASVDAILENLPRTTILHLASHGIQDARNPLDSGFVMRDGMLTVSRLMANPLPGAFLAFLSACETAKGDRAQPDQAVHLAATMLLLGFKSVVGTMWSMSDIDGPAVAQTVYAALFAGDAAHLDPDSVPVALDAAVRALRGRGLHPSRWAPYIHLGI